MRFVSSAILLAALSACKYEPQVTPPFDARVHLPTAAEDGPPAVRGDTYPCPNPAGRQGRHGVS